MYVIRKTHFGIFLEYFIPTFFWSFFLLFMVFCWSFGIFCGIFCGIFGIFYSRFYSNKSHTLYHEYPWNIPSVKKYTWNILFIPGIIPGIILVFGASQTTYYRFFIYILLLNVKQLLSIVWRRPTRHFKAEYPYFSTENFWRV